MSAVEVVLTDAHVWARSESTHWDGPPSIVPASDGTTFVVGEPLHPRYPAVSVVRLAAADRIAFGPALPTVSDALAVLFETVLTNLRMPDRCDRLTVLVPSEWGMRRRFAVEAAARRLVSEVAVEPIALRAAALGASTGQQQRIAVLELAPLTTTVSLVGRSGQQVWIEACEHEPTVGAADIEERGPGPVAAVVARLLAGHPPNYLLVEGVSEPGQLEALRSAIAVQCGFPVDVRPLPGAELIRAERPRVQHRQFEPVTRVPPTEWVGSLRERARADRPSRRRLPVILAAVAVVVIAAAAGTGVWWARRDSGPSAASPSSAAVSPTPGDGRSATHSFGRVQLRMPDGWHLSKQSDNRVDLSPDNGARQRITLVQRSLAPGAGSDEVAADLEAQIGRQPAGTFGEVRRDVVFGNRTGLSYEEFPGDGSTVRWHVQVVSGMQVSVGCQTPSDGWQPLAATCAQFVHDVRVTP
ncbi:type VII secretion-associated protein [Nocardia transvalensis]|uniref:type VII secretion-associated protein n=1 Tax=Nocardia transvalensis TaxID=37333 RepID=UPI0018958DD7|nr:type VII secretion-associated protein [Nocardia transvalensis]MBF6327465.1 type VII secretion-associated protein [Nocardia transvalensis]